MDLLILDGESSDGRESRLAAAFAPGSLALMDAPWVDSCPGEHVATRALLDWLEATAWPHDTASFVGSAS
ncbi:MAG: hypothetical protein ACOH17_14305 [Cellulomonas sp.]